MEVSLQDILCAREDRVRLQKQLLEENHCPLICYTMNIAGPVKNTPLIRRGFQTGLDALLEKLPAEKVLRQHLFLAKTGCTAMLAVDADPRDLKKICMALEESTPLGRLFDMDVLTADGIKLERNTLRGCLVCGAPGRECAASRRHPVQELQRTTTQILQDHFLLADREYIGSIAVQSLIDEVNTTPKPGLVDRRNNGSHQDMTLQHFLRSAQTLRPYFSECFRIGQNTSALSPKETFPSLRAAGLEAEKSMYQATGGVNTHKGLIYTMGLLCGSLGRLWTAERPFAETDEILSECAKIAQESVQEDLRTVKGNTPGERCYLRHGIGGIRSEIANGLPSVRNIALPCFEKSIADGLSQNDAGVIALINLIANVSDTNLYHRGGEDGAKWAAEAASAILPLPASHEVEALDNAFIQRNLSPGGCADLLAVTYFLHALK